MTENVQTDEAPQQIHNEELAPSGDIAPAPQAVPDVQKGPVSYTPLSLESRCQLRFMTDTPCDRRDWSSDTQRICYGSFSSTTTELGQSCASGVWDFRAWQAER